MSDEKHSLGQAVAAVMSEIRRLEKADKNKFANYAFTSIDDFKDAMRPLMAKHGLVPHVDEISFGIESFETTQKDGTLKSSTVAVYKYAMTLENAETGYKDPPEHATVALPFVGAQTSGIAKSYFIKEWFKSRFLASAGDSAEEADLIDNTAEMRLSKQAARTLDDELRKEIIAIVALRNPERLAEWWQEQFYRISTLPKDWHTALRTLWIKEGKQLRAAEDLDKMDNQAALADVIENELSNEEMDAITLEQDDTENERNRDNVLEATKAIRA